MSKPKTTLAKKWPDLAEIKALIPPDQKCDDCKLDSLDINCAGLCNFLCEVDIHQQIEIEE